MSWQENLQNSVRTAEALCQIMGAGPEMLEQYRQIVARYPMCITPYYLSLIDWNDPKDPIRMMSVPSLAELAAQGDEDTSGEQSNTKLDGVQHKYGQTVLILSTNQCAMYCRHCFRKRMVGLTTQELNERLDQAVAYIRANPSINNILVSGGDALLNPNALIARYLEELTALPQLDLIRFGSRLPVVLPERIYDDPELLDLFATYGKKKALYVVTQFNHPRELTPEAHKALACLTERGVFLRNQTVLLKGVNDDPAVLGELFRGLTRVGVAPYYVFQCRPVKGVMGHFQVPINRGVEIVRDAKAMQNGVGKSARYAMSHPRGKIEIVGKTEDGQVLFHFHQCKYPQEDTGRIFARRLADDQCWLDDTLN